MKKKTYQSFLLALGVLASFTSCSESESLHQSNLSNDRISFLTTLNNSWQSMTPGSNSSSRAALDAANGKGPIHVPTPFGKPLYLHPCSAGWHPYLEQGRKTHHPFRCTAARRRPEKRSADAWNNEGQYWRLW